MVFHLLVTVPCIFSGLFLVVQIFRTDCGHGW